jgi:GrpB-like predicted nucleotidyltransferase (UPF0157 family)
VLQIVDPSPLWPVQYQQARDELLLFCPGVFVEVEHIGSTAVPGLAAKPVIDVLAAVDRLEDLERHTQALAHLGYESAHIGIARKLFLRRGPQSAPTHHLHVVLAADWADQKERLFRDWLAGDPLLRDEYAELKRRLATDAEDVPAYTRAKTAFVQRVLDAARTAQGLPLVSAWDDDPDA